MNKCLPLLIVLVIFIRCASTHSTNNLPEELEAKALQPVGRFLFENNQLELIGTAVHFGLRFSGNTCTVITSVPAHAYLQYELDGVYQKRTRLNTGLDSITIRSENAGVHTVWIYKATEAATGPIFIQKIIGKNLESLMEKQSPMIEFIGNSITCGAAADNVDMPCNQGEYYDHHNAYYAYGPRVARALGVSYIISSVSGIGIYRNWNSDGPTMPQVYEKADLNINHSELWNFNQYHPVIVSIALGTNDFSNGDGVHKRDPFDSSIFISNYVRFIQLVKSKYPDAKIALLNSPMVAGNRGILFNLCLVSIKRIIDGSYPGSYPVSLFYFKPMVARGCAGHPSVEDHGIMANEVYSFFKDLLQQP
jgi:GDSL-like Lipase/Acylhydrolase.